MFCGICSFATLSKIQNLTKNLLTFTFQYPSTVTFGLSSVINDPPTSISQRPTTSSNFLQVPGSYVPNTKRPSVLSNTISADFTSTQCSHAPLVTLTAPKIQAPARVTIKRRQVGAVQRFGRFVSTLWQRVCSIFPTISGIRERLSRRLLIESDKGSPMRRLNQMQTETNFSGVVF
jgi:hypothetical protein